MHYRRTGVGTGKPVLCLPLLTEHQHDTVTDLSVSRLRQRGKLCHLFRGSISYGPPISVDLSDKLTPATPTWTGSFSTQYSGSFNCSTGNSEFSYTPILSTDSKYATILGFSNDKYRVRAEITSTHPNKTLSASGNHTASELNTPFTVRFTLVDQSGTTLSGTRRP